MKTFFTLLSMVLFTLPIFSQCAECPLEDVIKNGTFESPYCADAFQQGVVDFWEPAFSSPDIQGPDCFINFGCGESTMAALYYSATNKEGIMQTVELSSDPDINYEICYDAGGRKSNGSVRFLLTHEYVGTSNPPQVNIPNFPNAQIITDQSINKIGCEESLENYSTGPFKLEDPNHKQLIIFPTEADEGLIQALIDNIEITCTSDCYSALAFEQTSSCGYYFEPIFDCDIDIENYIWTVSFNDIEFTIQGAGIPTLEFPLNPGINYDVCLQVVDSRGCCTTHCTSITIDGEICNYYLCLDDMMTGTPVIQGLITSCPMMPNIMTYPYCIGDPGFCNDHGYQASDIFTFVKHLNLQLDILGDSGHARLIDDDPNCRGLVLAIENTAIEFLALDFIAHFFTAPPWDDELPFTKSCTDHDFTDGRSNKNDLSDEVIIFPNPADKFISINNPENDVFMLLDPQGRCLQSEIFNTSKFDVDGLTPGIYFIKNNRTQKTTPFIKK